MTRLFNDPAAFPQELLDGFAAAYPDFVLQVPGGVVRSTDHDEVAVIVGGGSGHYPAFCGLVGEGLAHGAAMGNLFSSPSAQQAYSVAKAADRGHGVIFTFGNYAGDVLHFGEAAERLNAEGIPARIVLVTDDIASAPPNEISKRRGIAGDLTVFKILGAAAAAGYPLEEVVQVGEHANDRTRSFGVAFAGCTMPGAKEPLFDVPPGMMSLGLGIHGEPGIADVPIPTADQLAEMLVERLLAERPEGAGSRISLLLNGLGTVKYEELFVVYRRVSALLADAGLVVVSPDLGELCTSLDMAGMSLTLFWLDDELERLWTSPSYTPAYRKGAAAGSRRLGSEELAALTARATDTEQQVTTGSAESRRLAERVAAALDTLTTTMIDAAEELGRIDAVAGDGDHGIGMERGARAARQSAAEAIAAGAGAGTVLARAGHAWADVAGGTSGALWGAMLRTIGERFGDESGATPQTVAEALIGARETVSALGKASVGDKTMVDVLAPYAEELQSMIAESRLDAEAWLDAAQLSRDAAAATRNLSPKLGRARPLAERSIGTPDAGAISASMIISAVTESIFGQIED